MTRSGELMDQLSALHNFNPQMAMCIRAGRNPDLSAQSVRPEGRGQSKGAAKGAPRDPLINIAKEFFLAYGNLHSVICGMGPK
jgi:hypothetical protein